MTTIINKNLKSLDQFIHEQYGKTGTEKRDTFDEGYEEFKHGALLQQARLNQGMTHEELAEKCGTNKGYVSRVENNISAFVGIFTNKLQSELLVKTPTKARK